MMPSRIYRLFKGKGATKRTENERKPVDIGCTSVSLSLSIYIYKRQTYSEGYMSKKTPSPFDLASMVEISCAQYFTEVIILQAFQVIGSHGTAAIRPPRQRLVFSNWQGCVTAAHASPHFYCTCRAVFFLSHCSARLFLFFFHVWLGGEKNFMKIFSNFDR